VIKLSEKKCLTLEEWETCDFKEITLTPEDEKVIYWLEKSGRILIKPYSDRIVVKAGPYVGAVSLSSFDLLIKPKLKDHRQLYKMIGYSLNMEDYHSLNDYVEASLTRSWITEVLAFFLVEEINKILVHGLLKRYQEKEESLSSPRGKINFNSLANYYGRGSVSVLCRYEDLSYDILENRALLTALNLVCPLITSPSLFTRAQYLLQLLGEEVYADNRVGFLLKELENGVDRSGLYYLRALELCKIIFRSMVFTFEEEGGFPQPAFLFNMAELFEKFLARLLSDCAPSGYIIKYQSGIGGYFSSAEERTSVLKPDYQIYWKESLAFIADAKYKLYDHRKVEPSDLYQLAVYQMLGEVEKAIIYYPSQAKSSIYYELRKDAGETLLHTYVIGLSLETILDCINNQGMVEKTRKEFVWHELSAY